MPKAYEHRASGAKAADISIRCGEMGALSPGRRQNLPHDVFRDFRAFLNCAFDSRDLGKRWT